MAEGEVKGSVEGENQTRRRPTAIEVNRPIIDRATAAAESLFADKMKAVMFRIGVLWAVDKLQGETAWRGTLAGRRGTFYFVADPEDYGMDSQIIQVGEEPAKVVRVFKS